MLQFELLGKGILAGVAIAAPVGPVNVLCVSRTISKGWGSGLVSGVGAALADTMYGSVAGFSISFVIRFLIREEFWIRLFGGILLIAIGIVYYFHRPATLENDKGRARGSDLGSTFLLNATNPTTVLSFMAVLAALGMSAHYPWAMTVFLVLGIFVGSMLWWIVLTGIVNYFRERFTDKTMMWMDRIAGLAIGAFGVLTLLLARSTRVP